MIGKTLGNFEITGQIGKGDMGEVYQAKDRKLGRNVAIKALPEEFARDSDRAARSITDHRLKKTAISGGAPATLCNAAGILGAAGPQTIQFFTEFGDQAPFRFLPRGELLNWFEELKDRVSAL